MHSCMPKDFTPWCMGSLSQLPHVALALPNVSLLAHCTMRPPAPLRTFIA